MRFLADESCDFGAVQALHASGHDVVAVADAALVELAAAHGDALAGAFVVVEPGRVRISRQWG